MRYTEKRFGKIVVPKVKLDDAIKKLADYEDIEELEDVQAYCLDLRRLANELRTKNGKEASDLVLRAADEIVKMSNFRNSAAAELVEKQARKKKAVLDYLDNIDGQLIDDLVSEIREKITEIL